VAVVGSLKVVFVYFSGPLGQAIRTSALIAETRRCLEFENVSELNLSKTVSLASVRSSLARSRVSFSPPFGTAVSRVKDMVFYRLLSKSLSRWLRDENPDVIVAETIPAAYVCLIANPRARIVADVHGLTFEQKAIQLGNESGMLSRWRELQNEVLTRADHFFVVSPEMKDYLSRDLDSARMTVVQNAAYPTDLQARFRRPPRFLFSGIFEYWEDPDTIAKLGRLLPPKTFAAIGYGNFLSNVVSASPHLEYLGSMAHDDAIRKSVEFQIGLVPSSTDITRVVASPVKLFEYLSVGLPVLAASVGSWSRLVSVHDVGWVVPRGDFCPTAMNLLDVSEDVWSDKSLRARRLIAERFNWTRVVNETVVPALRSLA